MALIAIERCRCESRLRRSWFHSSLPCFKNVSDNNPVNMLDPLRKRFGYGQLWPLRPVMAITASVQPESGRIHSIYRIRLPASVSAPIFQRRNGSYCAKPTRIRSRWPGQRLAKRIWSRSKPVCRNHLARFLAVSDFPTWFRSSTDVPDNIVQNQPASDLFVADRVRF